ncbi:MAG: hypothetical protein JRE20_08440 [Deltaproteobacteria bacterium]|nr:hypothetical protein [Deltaproteobacteria bacterium]
MTPEFAVAIYCGLKLLAATLVYCFETPVFLTGSQRETIGTCVPLLFHPPDGTQLHVSLRFSAPRYDTYCKIWDKTTSCLVDKKLFHSDTILFYRHSLQNKLIKTIPYLLFLNRLNYVTI